MYNEPDGSNFRWLQSMWVCIQFWDNRSECSVGVKEAWSKDGSSWSTHGNLHMVYCKLSQLWTMTDKLCSRLLTDSAYSGWGRFRPCTKYAPEIYVAHDLGGKLSPCMCSHSSCPDWSFSMVCAPWHKTVQCTARSGSPHNAEASF